MQIRWFVLAFGFFLLCTTSARAELDQAVVWGHDFAAAEAEAARLQRPLVIHFHATWCGPCRKMEKELLHTPTLLKTLDAGFVAVKVDVDKNPKVQQRFKIKSMPTDIVLGPDGKVLARSEGYDPTVRQTYLQNITRVDTQYAKAGTRLPRTVPGREEPKTEIANATPASTEPARTLASGDKLVPQPTEPRKVDVPRDTVAGSATTGNELVERPAPTVATGATADRQVAMDGYCPVTLRNSRSWKSGSQEYSYELDGQTYYFLNAEKLSEFKEHPEKFAPRLLGCDAVALVENDLAVRGSTKFGAFYEGSLFLFESAESRAKFKQTPLKYSQVKHALKPGDVKKVASNSGT